MLSTHEVDIWQIDLSIPQQCVQRCSQLLSSEETQRAARFYFEKHRWRFTVARAAMRQILGKYARLDPRKLAFSYGAKGKPEIAPPLSQCGITFNLSHSSELALLAVAHGPALGVDIEAVRSEFASDDIAERFFSTAEVEQLKAIPANERTENFFSCWTRKEAYIKAVGGGLSIPLDSFEVAFGPGVPVALLQVRTDPNEVSRWRMYNIDVPEGYKAALVAEGKSHRLNYLHWDSAA